MRLGPKISAASPLASVRRGFAGYGDVVAQEHELMLRGERRQAAALGDAAARTLREQVEGDLDALSEAIHAAAQAAQAEAARLETRTWAGVMLALLGALALALLSTAIIAMRLTRSLRSLSRATAAVATGSF